MKIMFYSFQYKQYMAFTYSSALSMKKIYMRGTLQNSFPDFYLCESFSEK